MLSKIIMSKQCIDENGLLLCGYHKKLKTMRKKFFVLYKDTLHNVARLEYYDNEKKFRSSFNAKRVIRLKSCFNINRRLDTKYDFVVALSTKEGGFGIVIETEEEMNKWLNALLTLQRKYANDLDFPQFDYVWQVIIQRKGIAEQKGLFGNYHVCLTNKSITFIKITSDKNAINDQRLSKVDVLLTTIRRCGDSQCYFYMEIGRQSPIGPGEFWMETEDPLIAQNMHRMILSKMTSNNDEQIEPMRKRSSSATEASKPKNDKKIVQSLTSATNTLPNAATFVRERCDSLPSRNRSSSECNNQNFRNAATLSSYRSNTIQRISNSPPIICSESEESSISIDESDDAITFLPFRLSTRASDGVILEESVDEPSYSDININTSGPLSNDLLNHGNLLGESEKYITMAPTNFFKEKDGSQDSFANNGFRNEIKHHPKEFSECLLDMAKESFLDTELQATRPVRAYSVGNKNQQIQIFKEKANESNTGRVRAFSVGSRAKIPRCDIQRIHPKLALNNNNIHYTVDNISSKKSISAPLLFNKYQTSSAERMSDLMEIDFSQPASRKYMHTKLPSKDTKNNCEMKNTDQNGVEALKNSLDSLVIKCVLQTDNGYLEMKPISIKSAIKNDFPRTTIQHPNSNNQNNEHFGNKPSNNIETSLNVTNDNSAGQNVEKAFITNVCKESEDSHENQAKLFIMNSYLTTPNSSEHENYKQMNDSSILPVTCEGNQLEISSRENSLPEKSQLNDKLSHSKSDNFESQVETAPYKFHIIESNSLNSALNINHEHLIKSDGVDYLNELPLTKLSSIATKKNEIDSKVLSSPSGLYYASLDLPACSRDYSPKVNFIGALSGTHSVNSKSSYAKIDFEHHDPLSHLKKSS
ncbi:insulin receptor substrate 1 chico isoform 1-T1 [Glossina fuscipes fuscipes]